MPRWLFKSEPDCYSFADLERDGCTLWDGVTNALARKHLREVQNGDQIWFYHTGDEKAIVGLMEAVGSPQADPNSDDPKSVVVEVKPVRKLKQPLPLARIKADDLLATWDLARLPRLSVVPVSPEQSRRVEQLVKAAGTGKTA
jgi:predicted RNA-binding protein with PUA-like domain